jgi:ABC-2 type transport system ATP-binding protein
MTDTAVLSIHGLEKSYQGFHLGPVSLEVEAGYVYTIMGPNGSGKSTLFRSLMGLIQPERGSIRWLEDRYGPCDMELKRHIAYVPEELDIPDETWSLKMWRDFVSAWYPNWDHAKYRMLLERYGMDESVKLRSASKGMRRKAALILALAQDPLVLVLDEPSSGLDPFAWRLMMEDLSDFMAAGDRTILMATHILEEIKRLGDYVFFWQNGRVLGRFEKDELMDGWKMFWVDALPRDSGTVPGVVAVEPQLPVRLVSNSPRETERAFNELGISIQQTRSLELDEIFLHVARIKEKSLYRKEP